jgi:uncharacterized repeat protein (TIGR01451 family)/gliding motility-associated-like protein
VDITVRVLETFTGSSLTNYAQIQSARDGQGNPATDRDSSPGNGFNNGEDDRDSEPVNVSPAPVYDLALNKSLAPGQASSVFPGATVTYRLTVTNEGNLPATQIVLSDSLPTGMALQDAAWTQVGSIATLNTPIAGPLASGASTFVDITVRVLETFTGSSLTNYAQIQSARDGQGNPATDRDSSPGNGFNNNEDDRDSEPITISQCPQITLTTTPNQIICTGETVLLSATSNVPATTINWYTTAVGGTAFASTASGTNLPLSPAITTTYYVEGTLANGCKSARTPITVTVNTKPGTPVASGSLQNVCPATTVNLTTVAISAPTTPGGVFEWRVGPQPTSPLVSNLTSVGAGQYYLFEKSVAGCYSNPLVVNVNITNCQCTLTYNVTVINDQEICAGAAVTVSATLTGAATSLTWSSSGTGTFSSLTALTTTYTPSALDIANGNVVLTASTNDPDNQGLCTPKSDALSVLINPRPAPVFGVACDDTLICLGKSTKLIGFAPGSTIRWYTTATGGTPLGTTSSGGKLTVSPNATTTYYAEAVSEKGCISSERTPVTVTVQPCFSDLAIVKTVITPGPYTPGQLISYSLTVNNLGIGNAKNVTVSDVLPSSLTFVSAVPASEYNSATGIWNIGDMVVTSNRTLIVNATIKPTASGTIVNTGIVRSPDNDPSKTSNDTSTVTINVVPVADLMLTKKVSKVNPLLNETITYSLEVKNDGPQVATNVEVTDLLPAGLEFVSSATLTRTGNILKGSIASIAVGETRTLTFLAKVIQNGAIKNVAQISKSDQKDPDSTPNNGYENGEDDESSVTVNVGCPVIEPPIIACAQTSVCVGTTVTLTSVGCKDGTVRWSTGATGASINVVITATTTFTAVCEKGECKSAPSNPITVKVQSPVKPILASNVSSVCEGGSAVLSAANCNGVLVWSTGATGTPLIVTPSQTTTYTAFCKIDECVSETASITIRVDKPGPPPIITCGKMEICPGESVVLTGHECEGVVTWSNGQTGTSITVSPVVTTSYSAKCVVGTCESPMSEQHTIKVIKPEPPLITSNKITVCPGGTATLTAVNCVGTVKWSNGATGSSIVVTLNASRSFTATCMTEACESGESNVVTLNVVTPTAPIISSDKTVVCSGETVNLRATGCAGIVQWSNGMTGASIDVKPTATTNYTAVCKIDECSSASSNTVTINVNTSGTPPVISASKTAICAGEEVTLAATGCIGTVTWSNGMEGASIKVSPTANTSYSAICKTSAGACASGASNTIAINVSTSTPPTLTADKTTICVGDSVMLSAAGCTGIVKWSNGMTGASIKVKPTATTNYSAFCETGACVSQTASITINVTNTPPPTIICSTDSICRGESVTLTIENCAGTALWSTNQTGEAIVVSPQATTIYTARCVVNGCQSAVSQNYTITVIEITTPVLTATKNPITVGESTLISASGCVGGSIQWSNGALGSSITVSPAATTMYTAVCKFKECVSDTARITIQVQDCVVPTPVVSNKRNVCPETTVDLTEVVQNNPSQGGTFIYRLGNTPTSPSVGNPQSVTTGTYYIFERSATGCFSPGARVDVTIVDCANDTVKTDLAIYKTLDTNRVEVGGEVTYSIKLKNNGPANATNITILDILPEGIQYVSGVGYSIEGNVIKGTIPFLAANDSLIFSCAVKVTGPGTIINVARIANLDQVDTNPANDASEVSLLSTLPASITDSVAVGVALAVTNVEPSTNGSYLVTYQATVRNHGLKPLTNVQLTDTLTKAFPAPVTFEVVGNPVLGVGSPLSINPLFNGTTQPNLLLAPVSNLGVGATEVVTFIVRMTPNGSFGPFYNSVHATGAAGATIVTDLSNNGFDTTPAGNTPTPVRLDNVNSIGISKMVGTPVEIINNVFDVPYTIMVKNLGMNDLTKVQVVDDLSKTFGNGAFIVPGSIALTADAGFTVDTAYTGEGSNINLLVDSLSSLPKGTTRNIMLTVRVDINSASSTTFNNVAFGTALGSGGVAVSDTSTSGTNPDPNNDLDPTNDSDPTPIVLNNVPGQSSIGVALSVKDTLRQSDGSYDVTYMVIVKNFGTGVLTNVQITDSLSKVFNAQTGATFRKVGTPKVNALSQLAINQDFDGANDFDLLISANSTLNAGVTDTLQFTINVSTDGRETPYLNQVYAFAKAGEVDVTDISTNGFLPDVNGNNDPTEDVEKEPTPLVIPPGTQIFIPEGFSPNGDGINDFFVIRNTGGQRVTLEIYNRWMTLVYKNNDYKNDWDGTTNNGLRVGSTSQGLPDGTYFYVVKLENGRQYVRYLTITR